MGTLYRPTVIRYRLPDGTAARKGTPGAKKCKEKGPRWHGRYKDAHGDEQQVKLAATKEASRQMLVALESQAMLERSGAASPRSRHRGKEILEHLDTYRGHLLAKGDTTEHVDRQVARITAVLAAGEIELTEDLQRSAVEEALAVLRALPALPAMPEGQRLFRKTELVHLVGCHESAVSGMMRRLGLEASGAGKARRYSREVVEVLRARAGRGRGPSTINGYLIAAKGLTAWLTDEDVLLRDPLRKLQCVNAAVDLRTVRRALSPHEFAELLTAALAGDKLFELSGEERALLYLTAARSGLRCSELASLTPASFDRTAFTVTVEARYSKRKRQDRLPVASELWKRLEGLLATRKDTVLIWPGPWPAEAADMLRHDLVKARIAYIDSLGRQYDFHALRHQFCSDLAHAGVHPKEAQLLARHSSIQLTMNYYTHTDDARLRQALEKLNPPE